MSSADEPLLLSSPPKGIGDWLLPVMMVASLSIHAVSFYLIQASSPLTTAPEPKKASLAILNPRNPDHQKILAWADTHDPGQMARSTDPLSPPKALLEVPYQPGFTRNYPDLRTVEASHSTTAFPSLAEPGLVPVRSVVGRSEPAASVKLASTTQVRLPEGLRLVKSGTALPVATVREGLPEPTRYLIFLQADGRLENAFLQHSSGAEVLDLQALHWLQGQHFQVDSHGQTVWPGVTFYWGREASAPDKP